MTVPMYFLFGAAVCLVIRAMFGLASLTDRHRQRRILDDLWDETDIRRDRPYDRDAA